MATDFRAFLVTAALYGVVCTLVLLFFGLFRRSTVAYKFYNPARFDERRGKRRPKPLPASLFGWVRDMYKYGQAEIAAVAGYDAATFIRLFAFGAEFFSFLALWCLVIVLPANISGNQVNYLIGKNATPTSNFTYWVPPPPPPSPPGSSPPPATGPPAMIRAPDFYEKNVPPAPAGLKWWKYQLGVPPLPQPADYFNSSDYASYGWKYDSSYTVNDYTFTNLDVTSLTNIGSGDKRLWVHLVSTWVISLYLWRLLKRYNRDAVALRMQFLTLPERTVESCTALVRDIPGVYYGTVADRTERTALRFLPAWIKRRIVRWGSRGLEIAGSGVDATLSNLTQVVLPDVGGVTPPNRGTPTPARDSSPGITTAPGTRDGIGPGQAALGPLYANLDADGEAARARDAGSSMTQYVEETFNEAFEGQVDQVRLCYDTRQLDKLVQEFRKTATSLEDLMDEFVGADKHRRKIKRQKITVIGSQMGQWGITKYGATPTRIDALNFYTERLPKLLEDIKQAQKGCLPPGEKNMPAAFVTFKRRATQVAAVSATFHHDRTAWRIEPAPGPEEVIWKNLGWRRWERTIRFGLVWAIFFVIVAFYIPVVSAVQALLQIDKILDLPGIRAVARLPLISTILASFIPTLVLRLFLLVLPYLLGFMGSVQGLSSLSQVEFSVVRKLFAFQFLTVFLTSLVAGTILSQLQQIWHNPSQLVTSLGAAAPQTATFFMLYLLLTGLIAKPLQFLRIPGLILLHVQTWLASTDRAKARLWQDQYVDYGWEIPDASVTLLLGLVYCLIQPLIVPIALLYFIVNSALYKYQLIYVHKPQFESGGHVWAQVFDHVMFSAFVFQLVMLGLVGLKGGLLESVLLLPLLFIWLFFWASGADQFRQPLEHLSMQAASGLDRHQSPAAEETQNQELYLHPALKISERELAPLLAQAQRVEEIIATDGYAPGLLASLMADPEDDVERGDRPPRRGSDQMQEMLLDPNARRSTTD